MKRPKVLQDDDEPVALQVGLRGLPIIDQFSEEGFVDNVLRIGKVSRERLRFAFHLGGWFGGAEVGFDCRVRRGIKAGFDQRMQIDHVYPGAVEVLRSGPESDLFLRALAQRYGLPLPAEVRMAHLVCGRSRPVKDVGNVRVHVGWPKGAWCFWGALGAQRVEAPRPRRFP